MGSIGAQTPGKVVKGKKMPGHFGNVSQTVLNLKIFSIDLEKQEVSIIGSIPGSINSWVTLKKTK
jgi:large subunit ribosomal protein L3